MDSNQIKQASGSYCGSGLCVPSGDCCNSGAPCNVEPDDKQQPIATGDACASGSSFSNIIEAEMITKLKTNLLSGRREAPVATTGYPLHAAVVCTQEVSPDLYRLIPSLCYYTDMNLHLICDKATRDIAIQIARLLGVIDRVQCLTWITPESLKMAEDRVKKIAVQNEYWKPGPIWWKLEGTRRVLEMLKGQSVLMLDSDIVFCNEFRNVSFENVDAVLSPFFWPDPDLMVPPVPNSRQRVHIAARDGVLNAGYAWITKPELMAFWLELYEAGIGGFYEQFVMGYLCQRFNVNWFDARHNFGQWRAQIPPDDTISLHVHANTRHLKPSAIAVQERATQAGLYTIRMLRERVMRCS